MCLLVYLPSGCGWTVQLLDRSKQGLATCSFLEDWNSKEHLILFVMCLLFWHLSLLYSDHGGLSTFQIMLFVKFWPCLGFRSNFPGGYMQFLTTGILLLSKQNSAQSLPGGAAWTQAETRESYVHAPIWWFPKVVPLHHPFSLDFPS